MTGLVNWNAGLFNKLPAELDALGNHGVDVGRFRPRQQIRGTGQMLTSMASECGLYLCVKEFTTKVANGTTQENFNRDCLDSSDQLISSERSSASDHSGD